MKVSLITITLEINMKTKQQIVEEIEQLKIILEANSTGKESKKLKYRSKSYVGFLYKLI